jgi:hypothetical protein
MNISDSKMKVLNVRLMGFSAVSMLGETRYSHRVYIKESYTRKLR